MSEMSSISKLIDMPKNDFIQHVKEIPNRTELDGLKKLFEVEYQKVSVVKDGLLEMKKTGEYKEPATPESVDKSLADLYAVLMILEEKCTVIVEEQKSRSVSVKS